MSQPLTIHQLVELQDKYSNVYDRSPTGARGWVRGRREIMDHEPEVYIEWDKDHWRYQGERDGWSFEHHFRPVEDDLEPLDTILGDRALVRDVLESLDPLDPSPEAEACPHCGEAHPPPTSEQERFLDILLQAQESLIDSDGYFIVTVHPRKEGTLTIFEPEIFGDCLTESARATIEAQIAHVAAELIAASAIDRVKGIQDEPGR